MKVKRAVLFVAILVVLGGGAPARAVSLAEEGRLGATELARLFPGKLVALKETSLSADGRYLLVMARDQATRQGEWHRLVLAAKKVDRQGRTPFQAWDEVILSPGGETALAFADYPKSLWALDVASGQWTRGLANGNPERLALSSLSPIGYLDGGQAFTVVDRQDAEGYVEDSLVVRLGLQPWSLSPVASLEDLDRKAAAGLPVGSRHRLDTVCMGDDGSLVFVVNTRSPKGVLKDLLLRYRDGQVTLLDEAEGRLFPLDCRQGQVLYNKSLVADGSRQVVLAAGGSPVKVADGQALVGALLPGGQIGLARVERQRTAICLGPAGAVSQVQAFPGSFAVLFSPDGRRVALKNDREVRVLRVVP